MGCVPSNNDPSAANDKLWNNQLQQDAAADREVNKLLLLGPGNSGKSTFFKQLLSIHAHGNNITTMPTEDRIRQIHDCIIGQMKAIIIQCEDLEIALDGNVQESADYITQLSRVDTFINSTVANHVTTLWNDARIKDAFNRRSTLGIVDSCPHFFDALERISSADYVPTEEDMLLVRTPTSGIVSQQLMIDDCPFLIMDVGGQRSERNKWIHCFDAVKAVLFVASLSCYDQALYELDYVNAMQEALDLFDKICNSRWFRQTAMIVFLNKADLFRIKIQEKELKTCFPEYDGPNTFKDGIEFVRDQFVEKCEDSKRQIYTHITCATDKGNVERVFNDVNHTVISGSMQSTGLI